MTNKVKMIFLNLVLLAGITVSMNTAYADPPVSDDASSKMEQDQIIAQIASDSPSGDLVSGTGPDGNSNCSVFPVGDGCLACAGCTGQCSFK